MVDGSYWNIQCSGGNVSKSAQAWGDLVRDINPGYSGPWPRMQLWHGENDEVLDYNNFGEAVKQWSNVHGLGQIPVFTDTPAYNQTRTRYGSAGEHALVEAIHLADTPHNLPVDAGEAIRFFGLDGSLDSGSSSSALAN
jgi:hypothetical protein